MNNWIEEEAERYHREKEEQLLKEELLNNSNHWAILRQQVERDVTELNNHPVWKEILGGIPVVVQNINDGFQIQKTTYPAVYVTVRGKDRQIEMKTETKDAETAAGETDETLQLDARDGKIILKKDQEYYVMPHEASRYILTPVLRALKK
jgi:hypothetical protein